MIPYTPPKPAEYIPIVDLGETFGGDRAAREAAAWEIHKAARDTGFFYVRSHGIEQALIDRAFSEARRFFEMPVEKKLEVSVKNLPGLLRGYDPMLAQQLDEGSPQDLKESFYLARELGPDHPYVKAKLPNHGPNQWPGFLPGFREGIEAYYEPMLDLGRHLMRLIALSLSLDETYFDDAVRNPSATLRLLRYPPQPEDAAANQLGAGAHTDYGAITLLAQDDCGGLEVENAAGEWLRADPVRGTFVVNLGDMIKRWTNDLYHSNMHRVYNTRANRDRYSLALFFNPDFHTRIACVPSCLPERGSPNYPPCTAGEHVAELIRRSYAKTAA
jgi:isopenicillin N synthase-like dioxygenase